MEEILFQMSWHLDDYADALVTCPLCINVSKERFYLVVRTVRGPDDSTGLLILAYANREVPKPVLDVLDGVERPSLRAAINRASLDGLAVYPDEYQRFVVDLADEVRVLTNRALAVTMWRAGVVGGPVDLGGTTFDLRWERPDGDPPHPIKRPYLAHQLPHGLFRLQRPGGSEWPYPLAPDLRATIETLLETDARQPLYHDLLREAFVNRRTNRRSSLVMCVAAIETGVKTLIADLQPDTAWLLENLPSPPVILLLRKLMADLPTRNDFNGRVHRPTKKAITVVKRAVELRNELVHGRGGDVGTSELELILETARGLLYLVDYYRGHVWACEFGARESAGVPADET